MKKKTEDRRIRRTKKALNDALTAIIIDGAYGTATIQDITDRADLNRATFYLHYGGKEALLIEMLEGKIDELMTHVTPHNWSAEQKLPEKSDLVLAFKHVADHAPLYTALFKEPKVGYIMQRIIDYIAMISLLELSQQKTTAEPFPLELAARAMAGSLFALLIWWLDNDMPYSPQKMADITADINGFGIFNLFGMDIQVIPRTLT